MIAKLNPFAAAARRSFASSKAGTASAQKQTVLQSPALKLYSKAERTGQPLKSAEWRV
jgi:hypothetical protein